MRFLHYEVNAGPSDIIEVHLKGSAANVQLMDSLNFTNYKNGMQYKYFGGYTEKTPVRLVAPHFGKWHVVIDTGGYPGSVQASVRVLGNANR